MHRWLATLALFAACTGSPSTPTPAIPEAPPMTRRADPAAGLPRSTARAPVPDGLLEVRFDDGGLRVLPPGGEPVMLAASEDGTPAGMSPTGARLPALEAWAEAHLPPVRDPRAVVVAVPGEARYAVLKAILRALYRNAAARSIHLVVQDAGGAERSIPLDFPDPFSLGEGPVTLQVLLDPAGLTVAGLRDTAATPRRSFPCTPACAGPETYDLAQAGRLGYRLHARHGADHVLVVPHNDVRVDVIVGVLDHTRDDTLHNARGEVVFPHQALAGSRIPELTDEDVAQRLRFEAARRMRESLRKANGASPGEVHSAGPADTDGGE